MIQFKEYNDFDALGLAELVRKRQVTPAELVEAAIERIEAVNGRLNAVVYKLYDQARVSAQAPESGWGPLGGVPMLMKYLLSACAGAPLSSGSRGAIRRRR